MLLNVAARHGVRVQSLQHVLEGYKIAAEIAAHGASASTFSDWWAYKYEAKDAIPYNAALLTQAGVSVCIKSDSEELIRHLNLEAAKMVKYGGVTEAQALAMITINPARELGLDHRLGSIEVGKDADIVLFNAHPFDAFARCELALIDGEVWFQRPEKDNTFAPRPGDHTTMPMPGRGTESRNLEIPQNPKGTYALVKATLHPVSGPDIADGTLVIEGGKITAVGGPETPFPPAADVIDAQGFDIWPGLIDAGTRLGLYEIGSLSETHDDADSAQFQPELRTSSALYTDSEQIPVTRANGVLTAYVQPAGGLISGQGCVIGLDGFVPRELVLADSVALNVTIPPRISRDPDAPRPRGEGPDPRQRRRERIESIKEEFRRALAYDKVRAEAQARQAPSPYPDPRLVALAPYAKGERPVIFRADHREEILDALKLAQDLNLKAIISGGAEAWKAADALEDGQRPRPRRRHAPAPGRADRPLRRLLRQPRAAVRGGSHLRHPLQRPGTRAGDRRPQPAVRSRHCRRLRPARARGAEGHHPQPGEAPGPRRPGRVARGGQARQPGHHRRPHPPADDRDQGALPQRQAAPPREQADLALRALSSAPGRSPDRRLPARDRSHAGLPSRSVVARPHLYPRNKRQPSPTNGRPALGRTSLIHEMMVAASLFEGTPTHR